MATEDQYFEPSEVMPFGRRRKAAKEIDLVHRLIQPTLETDSLAMGKVARSLDSSADNDPSTGSPSARRAGQANRVLGIAEPATTEPGNRIPEVGSLVEEIFVILEKKLRTERERRGFFA